MMRRLVRYGYFPLVFLGLNGAAILGVENGFGTGFLFGLLGLAILVSFLAERLLPYNPDWNREHGDVGRDLAHAIANEGAQLVNLLILPFLAATMAVGDLWPHAWPFVLQVLFAVLVLDFGITMAHWASHRVSLLWRFHAVHHSVERMYGFNGLMKHPLHQLIETSAGALPLLLLGLPAPVAAVATFCVATQLLLQHSNVDMRTGPLKYVVAVSEVHRFHHRKWPGEGDVNFGLFFAVWDHLLGTFHYEERARRFVSSELGIGAEPGYPRAYLQQLWQPFRPIDYAPGAAEGSPSPRS